MSACAAVGQEVDRKEIDNAAQYASEQVDGKDALVANEITNDAPEPVHE